MKLFKIIFLDIKLSLYFEIWLLIIGVKISSVTVDTAYLLEYL